MPATRPLQIEQIVAYAQAQIRNQFDNEPANINAVGIIEQARLLGFMQLAEEMITDLATSQDNLSERFIRQLIATHEERNHVEYEPEQWAAAVGSSSGQWAAPVIARRNPDF